MKKITGKDIKPRTFEVSYVDRKKEEYHTEVSSMFGELTDLELITEIIEAFKTKGYKVICIVEMLNGISMKESQEMVANNPVEAINNIKIRYVDKDYV